MKQVCSCYHLHDTMTIISDTTSAASCDVTKISNFPTTFS